MRTLATMLAAYSAACGASPVVNRRVSQHVTKIVRRVRKLSCPFCGERFLQNHVNQKFCKSTCKDGFWNAVKAKANEL